MQEEAEKNLFNKKLTNDGDTVVTYAMPLLETISKVPSAQELEDIEQGAYEKGFTSGERAGFAVGEEKAAGLIEQLELLIRELTALKARVLKELEPDIVELSVSIARKIILKELALRPEEIVSMTKEAIMRLERTGQIIIKINPSLYDLFMKHKKELLDNHPEITFDMDPSVAASGSVVMGPVEDIVTDIDEQIRNIIKDMGERLAGN